MSLPINSSCDNEIKVKGLPNIEVGNWHCNKERIVYNDETKVEMNRAGESSSRFEYIEREEIE
jgi:hypothetical protein